ncbi:GNAT family N-acetyltransferase [Sphingomonas nostoxanthinifaciens]|uniref:GNAT family N-acetyltransferase n=1 Tax=Sphingomonas nostoxanthinifaciens TaxID=2872652 RepID=UPI001CC1DD4E|nr:N-acetyltransferase [Sphingomonas nostoxanthinifaciens]UAK22980.1 N-acetyltransferase [Sphingomonas nostoxanthinifaciens]
MAHSIALPEIVPLDRAHPLDVERLLDTAFGIDRHRRTAYRIRAGMHPIARLSLAALDEHGKLAGSLQSWPVALTAADGAQTPLVLVGPVAIAPERQGSGLGRALMNEMIARAEGGDPLVLIGDPEYYGRFFGFSDAATGGWQVPGPVERHRLLARTHGRTLPATGMLTPRR